MEIRERFPESWIITSLRLMFVNVSAISEKNILNFCKKIYMSLTRCIDRQLKKKTDFNLYIFISRYHNFSLLNCKKNVRKKILYKEVIYPF